MKEKRMDRKGKEGTGKGARRLVPIFYKLLELLSFPVVFLEFNFLS